MKETVILNSREQQRGRLIGWALADRVSNAEAARLAGLSVRHFVRLKAWYQRDGPAALAHGNRGRAPAHALSAERRAEVLAVARDAAYHGYNHTHLHEVLVEQGLALSRRSLSRLLAAAGMRSPRRRRPRRERAPQRGMLVQVDASEHDWLEGRGTRLTLVGAVDDATSELVAAHFQRREDSAGYLRLLRDSVRRVGIPVAWYADKHSCFQRNDKEPWTLAEELAGRREPTQVARALGQLGIQLIPAHTPQAKGRVERCWGTLQDRLVKELRRANARTPEEANAVLAAYLPRFNARFAIRPAQSASSYHRLPHRVDLDGACSFHYVRTVANDNTIRLEERRLQVPPGPQRRSYARCRVELQERLDGTLVAIYKGQVIARDQPDTTISVGARGRQRGRELACNSPTPPAHSHRRANPADPAPSRPCTPPTPAANHPWRQPWIETVTKSLAK
jgi:transposase